MLHVNYYTSVIVDTIVIVISEVWKELSGIASWDHHASNSSRLKYLNSDIISTVLNEILERHLLEV